MFFFLSKTIYFIAMPLGWIILCFLLSWKLKTEKWRKRMRWATLVLLLFFTNPFLANLAMYNWEQKPVSFESLKPHHTAVVLTGVAKNNRQPFDRVFFNKGADRVTHTVQLYKMGKIKHVLISGGSGALLERKRTEADNLAHAFVLMGVPDSVITIENKSKNTHMSAVNIKNEWGSELEQPFILVTSGFHMLRSVGCFKKEGLAVTPFPVDYHSDEIEFSPTSIIPSPNSLEVWHIIFHEILGITVYSVVGYL